MEVEQPQETPGNVVPFCQALEALQKEHHEIEVEIQYALMRLPEDHWNVKDLRKKLEVCAAKMAPSKQYNCAKHSLGYIADLHSGLQSLQKLKDFKQQQKQTHIESLMKALQQQEESYQQELDQLEEQITMVQEQIQTMQNQTHKLNGGASTPHPPSPATPHYVPVVQPAMIQELAKILREKVYPDKATDAQTLEGFSQAVAFAATQVGLMPPQANPSSSASASEDTNMGPTNISGSKRELSPTAAGEPQNKPKDHKTS
eukprot:12413752-Karenia_brevis.AAC.1